MSFNPEKLAECFPLWSYLHEEMLERHWDIRELAIQMGGDVRAIAINELTLEMLQSIREPHAVLGEETANKLSIALGASPEMFINLDNAYRIWLRHQRKQ